VTTHDLFAQASWRVVEPLRLIGGVRLTLLPDEYRSTRRQPAAAAAQREVSRVEDTTQVNGQVGALWTPTQDQVLKLIWGTASQDSDQFNLPEPERIETLEASYTLIRPHWIFSAAVFQNDLSQLVRTIQRFDGVTGSYRTVDDNSGTGAPAGSSSSAMPGCCPSSVSAPASPGSRPTTGRATPIRATRQSCSPS